MASVLVLGASGFIGAAVSSAFARAGYKVYGLIRNPDKAKALLNDEIEPVIGDGYKPETYEKTLAKVGVVVNTMTFNSDDQVGGVKTIIGSIRKIANRIEPLNGSITFVQTSGTWVYGDNKETTFTEDSPQNPLDVAISLSEIESIVHSFGKEVNNVRAIIIRPTFVYGKSGGLSGVIFDGVMKGCVKFPGDLTNRYPTVHVDDLAELYVKAANSAPILNGVSLNASNPQSESVRDIIDSAFRAAGKEAIIETYEPSDLYVKGLASSQIIDNKLAKNLTGWEPRKPGLVDGIHTYLSAWKAYNLTE